MAVRPMVEWLRVVGSPSPVWVTWARNRAAWLYETGIRPQQRLRMADGTEILIRLVGEFAHILVVGGGGGAYQFIGSLDHLYKTFDDDNLPAGTRYLPLVYAVHAEFKGGNWKTTPLISSGEDVPTDPAPTKPWTYDADPRNTDDHLILSPAHQWDGKGMHQWYGPTEDTPKRNIPWLMTQWQQGAPLNALGRWSGGSNAYWTVADQGYDFGPTYFADNGLTGVNKSPDSDWYCRAAIHRAGDRTFVIMADINSVFYCYPTTGYDQTIISGGGEWPGEKANVPTALTQSQACPWPAWVTAENLGVAAIEEPAASVEQLRRLRPLWVFNQAGTRAACIAAHRDAAWADGYFTSSLYTSAGSYNRDAREDYPGLVEVEFTIEVTGSGDGDFSFSVALRQSVYSKTDQRCPVAVGYAMRTMGNTPLDALLMLEYQHFTDIPAMAVVADYADDAGPPTLYQPRRPNRTTVAVVQRQDGAGWNEVRRWLAYYACYPIETRATPEPRAFSPVITDLDGVPASSDYWENHFVYIAQTVALDLSSLSVCVGASLWTVGTVPRISGDTYGAEASTIVTIAFDVEQDRRSVGNADLKPVTSAMFDLTHPYPDLSGMTQFHLNATADYTHYTTGFAAGTEHEYATLDVTDGAGNTWSNVIQDACEDMAIYPMMINNSTLFPSQTEIWCPAIFAYFDGWPMVRPGMRWRTSGGWQAGSLSFSGYPYAAVHHGAMVVLTLTALNNVQQAIKVHRNGSWSIFAGPFAAQTALMTTSEDIPDSFEQTLIDRVVLMGRSEVQPATNTHIALLNQAFSKTLTPEDYHFEFRKVGYGTVPEFRPKSDDPTPHDWHAMSSLAPAGIVWSNQYLTGSRPLCLYCFSSTFTNLVRYASYDGFSTFPNPRMECTFPPPV